MSEENRTPLYFNGSIKMLRETLCHASSDLLTWAPENFQSKLDDIQQLINEIDRHRPLGPDGKHGNRHTNYCGCEDKPGWDKDLGEMARFYIKVPLDDSGATSRVLNAEGLSMYRSLSRSLAAFQRKRDDLVEEFTSGRAKYIDSDALIDTEMSIKHYEGLLSKLMGEPEMIHEDGEKKNG